MRTNPLTVKEARHKSICLQCGDFKPVATRTFCSIACRDVYYEQKKWD